jgi:hypothetical protein
MQTVEKFCHEMLQSRKKRDPRINSLCSRRDLRREQRDGEGTPSPCLRESRQHTVNPFLTETHICVFGFQCDIFRQKFKLPSSHINIVLRTKKSLRTKNKPLIIISSRIMIISSRIMIKGIPVALTDDHLAC